MEKMHRTMIVILFALFAIDGTGQDSQKLQIASGYSNYTQTNLRGPYARIYLPMRNSMSLGLQASRLSDDLMVKSFHVDGNFYFSLIAGNRFRFNVDGFVGFLLNWDRIAYPEHAESVSDKFGGGNLGVALEKPIGPVSLLAEGKIVVYPAEPNITVGVKCCNGNTDRKEKQKKAIYSKNLPRKFAY